MMPTDDEFILPPATAIREAASEILARPYYELGPTPRRDASPWLLKLLDWLIAPFRWLFEAMEGWPEFVRWIVVVVLAIICVALIAHIMYSLIVAIRGPIARRGHRSPSVRQELDPDELESKSQKAAREGDYIGAIRLLFRAALRRIELAEERRLRPGCTNRELLRRYRASPLFESLRQFVETIDLKWYGGASCDQADYVACREEHSKIQNYVQASRIAHSG